jgi:AbrB family looped-hinge helix DNA binding protein
MSDEAKSKITFKGQVTIPRMVREALGLAVGDEVTFVVRDGTAWIEPRNVDTKALRGMVKRKGKPVSLEQMEQAIRDGASKGER